MAAMWPTACVSSSRMAWMFWCCPWASHLCPGQGCQPRPWAWRPRPRSEQRKLAVTWPAQSAWRWNLACVSGAVVSTAICGVQGCLDNVWSGRSCSAPTFAANVPPCLPHLAGLNVDLVLAIAAGPTARPSLQPLSVAGTNSRGWPGSRHLLPLTQSAQKKTMCFPKGGAPSRRARRCTALQTCPVCRSGDRSSKDRSEHATFCNRNGIIVL